MLFERISKTRIDVKGAWEWAGSKRWSRGKELSLRNSLALDVQTPRWQYLPTRIMLPNSLKLQDLTANPSHVSLRWSLLLGNFMRNAGFSSQVYNFPYRKNSIFHTSHLTWHQYSSFYVLLINTFRISEYPYFLKIKNKYFGFSD